MVVVKWVPTVFWKTVGKFWETVLVSQNTLKNTARTSPNLKIKHKKQNNNLSVIILHNEKGAIVFWKLVV